MKMAYIFGRLVRMTWWQIFFVLIIWIVGFLNGMLFDISLATASALVGWFLGILVKSLFVYASMKRLAEMADSTVEMVAYANYELGWHKGYIEENAETFQFELDSYIKK
jgi:hypothetical protein